MKHIILIVIFMFMTTVWANGPFTESSVKQLCLQIEDVLKNNIQNLTHRKNISITVQYKIIPQQLNLFLKKRSERDTLFVIQIKQKQNSYTVAGKLLNRTQYEWVKKLLDNYLAKNIDYLVAYGILGQGRVIAKNANLYVDPENRAGGNLASQFVFGTPIAVLEESRDKAFLRVQGYDDKYIGWIKVKDIVLISREQWQQWISQPILFVRHAIKTPDIPVGARVVISKDKKQTYIVQTATDQLIEVSKKHFYPLFTHPSQQEVIVLARQFLPQGRLKTKEYLWGGTAHSQLDCSGFVQLTYRLHNVLLPRDADQQFQYSKPVIKKEMRAGDLIFFSKNGLRPTHVGMYIGNGNYIHCSASGGYSGVKVNQLEGDSKYEKYLKSIYFASGRILQEQK